MKLSLTTCKGPAMVCGLEGGQTHSKAGGARHWSGAFTVLNLTFEGPFTVFCFLRGDCTSLAVILAGN